MNQDLFEEMLREEMRDLNYPQQVDVVESVMAQIAKTPILVKTNTNKVSHVRRYVIGTAAACLTIALGIGVLVGITRLGNQPMGTLVSDVSNYVQDYANPDEYYSNQFSNIENFILSNSDENVDGVVADEVESD